MKALIPAALLLSLCGAAQAQMTIYGLIDMSYGKSIFDDAAGLKDDFHSGGDNGSGNGNSTTRFGIKGSTDVGSGIKANFQLESGGITSDGEVNTPFFQRQAWLGFSGNFGEVRLGRQDSVAWQTMVNYDFNGASNGVSAMYFSGVAPWEAQAGRQSRSLQYISPDWSGFKFQLGYVPEGSDPATTGNKHTFSAGGTFASGPFSLSAVVESKRTENTGSPTDANFGSVAGSWDFGFVKVMGGYTDGATGFKGYSTGFVAPVAGINMGMLYGKNTDTKGQAIEVFINKEVLKNTYAYFEYGHSDDKVTQPGSAIGDGYAVGVIFTF